MALGVDRNQRASNVQTLKRHILTCVFARIDFDPIFNIESLAADLHAEMKEEFSISKIGKGMNYTVDIANLSDPSITVNEEKTYELKNINKKKQLKINSNNFILEYFHYVSFDAFKDELRKVLKIIENKYKAGLNPIKISLRKINHFIRAEDKVEGFKDYFNPALIAHLNSNLITSNLFEDKHLITTEADGFKITIQYGTERGTMDSKPARRFVLDFHVYSEVSDTNVESCLSTLEKKNELIFDLFWWAAGKKLKDYMSKQD